MVVFFGGGGVVVFLWCFLWWCFCGVFVVVFSNIAQSSTEVMDVVKDCHQTFVVVFLWWCFCGVFVVVVWWCFQTSPKVLLK